MHMITVRNIISVRHALDHAETVLQAFRKLIGRGLQRRTVQAEINIRLLPPLFAGIVQIVHDFECKRRSLRIRMTLPGHIADTLAQAGIAQRYGRIPVVEKSVDLLSLLKPCQRAILPEDRRYVRGRAF